MRELILKRIAELSAHNSDVFGKPNRKGKLTGLGEYWPVGYDFAALSDENLIQEFEQFVRKCYTQR